MTQASFPSVIVIVALILSIVETIFIGGSLFAVPMFGTWSGWVYIYFIVTTALPLCFKKLKGDCNWLIIMYLIDLILHVAIIIGLVVLLFVFNASTLDPAFQVLANVLIGASIAPPIAAFILHLCAFFALRNYYASRPKDNEKGGQEGEAPEENKEGEKTEADAAASFEAHTLPLLEFRV